MIDGIWPDQGSTYAPRVDHLFLFLCGVAFFFSALICGLIIVFVLRFRRKGTCTRVPPVHSSLWLEGTWFAVPLVLTMVMFAWGARLYFEGAIAPAESQEVYVVAKQWMWKVQHPNGKREINRLHVPVGQSIRLTIASEDVIHSFYVPAFRVKMDAVPGRYSQVWFEPSKAGSYHLFCAEYCGTNHSRMTGRVIVMEPSAYQSWLSNGAGESMVDAGKRLFDRLGCRPCHADEATRRGPALADKFGTTVQLAGGGSTRFDAAYARESILKPGARIVAGYDNIMPTFRGQIGEEGILQLIAYIEALNPGAEVEAPR